MDKIKYQELLKLDGFEVRKVQHNLKNTFKKDKAFLITKNLYGQEKIGKSLLYFIPAEIFLLSL